MAEKKIKVGLAGIGRAGWGMHSKELEMYKDLYKLVAAMDPEADRLAEMEKRFKGCRTYQNFDELLADKAFTDEIPRKNCLGIRKFLVLNQQPLLPYLAADETVLRGMKLFPGAYPDSVLDDITDSTFRLKVPDRTASIIQKVSWSKLRKDEGEDRIIITLINSSQLAKLSEEFREYLYVRAFFLGVDPELLKKRFDRASDLSAEKRDELAGIVGFFRKSVLDEED